MIKSQNMAKSILTKTILFVIPNFPLLTGFVACFYPRFLKFRFPSHTARIYGLKQGYLSF